MYVRYAHNILTGDGYTWNAGEKPVFGCTSITYTFFILCIKIALPFLKATTILITASTFFSIASLFILFITLKTVLTDISRTWILVVLAILGLQPLFLCHSLSGMDASCAFFFNSLNMLFVYKAYTLQKIFSVILAVVSSYLVYLTRVDSAFVAFVFPVILFLINTSSRKREEKESYPIPNSSLSEMNWLESSRAIDRLCKKLPANTLITGSEHGFIAAYNPLIQILDLTGLHDPLAKNGYSEDYLIRRKPKIVWLAYHDNTVINHQIISGTKFKENYHFIPGAFSYGVAVLKEDKEIQKILETELTIHYPNISIKF